MPIVVDPGFVWPPEVDPVVSPDGRLTAIVDPAHAGVLLRADFDDSVPDTPAVPEKVLRRNLAKNPRFSNLGEQLGGLGGPGSWAGVIQPGASAQLSVVDGWLKVAPSSSNDPAAYIVDTRYFDESKWQGRTFTVSATLRLAEAQTGSIVADARRLNVGYVSGSSVYNYNIGMSSQAPNEAGEYRLSVTATVPADAKAWFVRARSGSSVTPTYWTDVQIEEGSTASAPFNGSTPASGKKRYRYASDGTSEEYIPGSPFVPGHGATVAKVRFERQDGTVVRSGNPAWAPGGYAHAYDHEAMLGGGTLWRAVPIRFDGTEGEPSEYVGAVIPPLSDGWAWLKPVTDPDKAMLLKVEPPDLSYDGRVDTTSIAGAPRPAATWDVFEGFTTQLRSLVREKDVEEQLMALLDEGPVLAQFPACAGLPDFYFIRGKLDLEHVHWDGWPWRRYQWDVIQIDRPDTTDSSLRIPGLSYDTVARDWTTYDQLRSTVESYNKLLEP